MSHTLPAGASIVGHIYHITPDNIILKNDVKIALPYNSTLASPSPPRRTLSVSRLKNGVWVRVQQGDATAQQTQTQTDDTYDVNMKVVWCTTRQLGVFAAVQREEDRCVCVYVCMYVCMYACMCI